MGMGPKLGVWGVRKCNLFQHKSLAAMAMNMQGRGQTSEGEVDEAEEMYFKQRRR